jgi:hypothetical protein
VRAKVHLFFLNGFGNWDLVDNIFLSSVLDTDVTHSEVNFLVKNHALGIGSSVHDINLCDNTNSSDTFGINFHCHL